MIRLGIAGIGTIASDYIDMIFSKGIQGAELSALCSRNAERMAETLSRYPTSTNVKTFTSYDGMLASGEIDAVLITTPHGMHPSMAKEAVEAGVHVLVEKPVGIFGDEVIDILRQLDRSPGIVCGVFFNRRASPAYRYLKQLLDSGELGELVRCTWIITNLYRTDAYYHSGTWRGTWQGEGGGLLMTQASHQLDLMQWLCGMPLSVLARCSSIQRPIVTENEAELLFEYPNGAHGHFVASAHECPGTNLLEISGTRGKISMRDDCELEVTRLDQDEREFAKLCVSPFEKVPQHIETIRFDHGSNKVEQRNTIQNFVNAINGTEVIQCSLEDGLRSLQIIHGAYLSQHKRAAIILPPSESEFRSFLNAQEENPNLFEISE